jgi:hypothetical protein
MTCRQLQQQLKQLRSEGKIPANFKLNQKKAFLLAMWEKTKEVMPENIDEMVATVRVAYSKIVFATKEIYAGAKEIIRKASTPAVLALANAEINFVSVLASTYMRGLWV